MNAATIRAELGRARAEGGAEQPIGAAVPPSEGTRITEIGPLSLESGELLPATRLAWRSWGQLSARGDNAVLVCHALTGTADLDRWWPELLGRGRAFDPERDFVVCANVLGGCAGSTGPLELAPDGQAWGGSFPALSIRDQVAAEARLLAQLGVTRLAHVAGGSMGGMRALEWVVSEPIPVTCASIVAAPARHSSWAIGLSAAQRAAIEADPRWAGGSYRVGEGPAGGLAAARRQAMLAYRSWPSLEKRFGRSGTEDGRFAVEAWLDYHGRDLVERFDAATYVGLTRAMDSHDIGRGRGGIERALAAVRTPCLVVGISTDTLYPASEVRELAAAIGPSSFELLESLHGHDAFLIDSTPVGEWIRLFRRRVACQAA